MYAKPGWSRRLEPLIRRALLYGLLGVTFTVLVWLVGASVGMPR